MATTLNFDEGQLLEYTVFAHRVYLRERWSDDWAEEPHLYPVDVLWNAAPEIPTATLVIRYGRGLLQGEEAFAIKERLAKRRWYVKIEIEGQFITGGPAADPLLWYGTLECDADHRGGVRDEPPADDPEAEPEPYESGSLELVAHGLELLLARTTITESVYYDSANDEEIRTHRGLTFNTDGLPNRISAPRGGRYIFNDDVVTSLFWNTRGAVEYLLTECTIRTHNDALSLNFLVDFDYLAQLPNWDAIQVDTHGKTLFDLLNELIPRQRLLGWTLRVDEEANTILLRPFTFTGEDIEAAAGEKLLANRRLTTLIVERSPGVAVVLKTSAVEQFDQVIAQGRRRRICFSVCDDNDTLVKGWTPADETGYEAGASGAGDYPAAAEISERRRRDADVRGSALYEEVFSRFKLPAPWDFQVGDPVAGGAADTLIIPDEDPLPYTLETYILPTLPLLTNRDYSGSKIEDGAVTKTGAGEPPHEMLPQAFFQLPHDTDRYVRGERIAIEAASETARRDFTVVVRVPEKSRAVNCIVSGGPQHLIATLDFDGLAHDWEEGAESWFNWQKMILTLAIEDDRHAEGRYPSDDLLSLLTTGPAADGVRRKVIDAGPSYKLDWIVKGTVIGTDPDTQEPQQVEVDEGDGVYVHDDRIALEAIAKVAHAWYGVPRRALTFVAHRISAALAIGDLITSIGSEDFSQAINSVVTQMHVTIPRVEGGAAPGPARIEYTTAYAELDPLQFAPRAKL